MSAVPTRVLKTAVLVHIRRFRLVCFCVCVFFPHFVGTVVSPHPVGHGDVGPGKSRVRGIRHIFHLSHRSPAFDVHPKNV